ncbi:hypothetical protein BCR36DRAFT_403410 [Piromyces finnis]|uniref:SET domain-containing protein n=1 Tax=Piromyces finnis TaxID=1754191 RepID=A0A1Y1VEQ2_9FUNG|nr:hypothetical protein BCR36DRAFT_403410 [Piromyces finnis]|eukprot:ORX53703.1 hypothetical protein BCR36DRAFT_403410 [Piromyces finnis]
MQASLGESVSMLSNLKINDILKVDPQLQKFQKQVSLKITLKQTDDNKKYAISSLNLPVGTCVHEEKALASILKYDYLKDLCNHCFGYFERNKNPLKMPNIYLSDGEENKALYCSNKCRDEAKSTYNLISPFLHNVSKIAKDNGFEVDVLRLIVFILAQNKVCNDNCVLDLISELPAYEEKDVEEVIQWYKKLERSVNELYAILPEELKPVSQEKLYEIACKVCNYSLSPCDQGHTNPEVGLALYPITSLFFRQSCDPNCTITYEGTNVQIFTIKPVKVGEELCVSYVDLYQARYERGQEIYMKKHEWCQCSRCTEDINQSVDRFVCGLLCDECKKDVYPVDSNGYYEYQSKVASIKEKTEKRREKIRELVKQEFEKIAAEREAAANGEIPAQQAEQTQAQSTENTIDQAKQATRMFFKGDDENIIEKETLKIIGINENDVYTCPSCKHERNKAEILSFLQRVSDHFIAPITFLQNGQYGNAAEFFNRILDRYSKFLHPQSYYLMNARVQLLNCYIYEQKWDDCIQLAKTIIEAKEKSDVYTTKYSPEIMDLYENLGDYCTQSLEAKKSDILNTSSSNSDIRKKYLIKERSKAYESCLELRSAVYGKDHPKTLAVQRKIDAL